MAGVTEEEVVLPRGRVLKFNLLETWGDPDYIGLTGIELFGPDGEMIKIPSEAIKGYKLFFPVISYFSM